MYKILIIDDEAFIADGLAAFLKKRNKTNLDIYTCYSSNEALDLLQKISIDIIITDINMPQISGLELIKKIKEKWQNHQIIVISGYDNFCYAQEAIKLGASYYLLKGEENSLLLNAVDSCIKKVEENKKKDSDYKLMQQNFNEALPSLRNKILIDILFNKNFNKETVEEKIKDLKIEININIPFQIVGLRIDEEKSISGVESYKVLLTMITNFFESLIKEDFSVHLIFLSNPKLGIWLIQKKNIEIEDCNIKDIITDYVEYLQNYAFSYYKIILSFIIKSKLLDIEELNKETNNLINELTYKDNFLNKKVISDSPLYNSSVYNENINDFDNIKNKLENLNTQLKQQNKDHFFELLKDLIHSMRIINIPEIQLYIYNSYCALILNNLIETNLLDEFKKTFNFNIFSTAFSSWNISTFEKLIEIGQWLYNKSHDENNYAMQHKVIIKIDKYIKQNINKELSLNIISDYIGLNPVYLSRLYKNITGKNLSSTITETRINLAKKLLSKGSFNVSEIVEMVGFKSLSHFSRIFKKEVGMSPKEFQNHNI